MVSTFLLRNNERHAEVCSGPFDYAVIILNGTPTVGVREIPKRGSESKFQKLNHAIPNYFRNSEKVSVPKSQSMKAARKAGKSPAMLAACSAPHIVQCFAPRG